MSWLNKSEFRTDKVRDAIAGRPGPIGGPALTIDGDATSRRVLNSLSVNWTPLGDRDDRRPRRRLWYERGEFGFFWGTRYNFDRFGADDVKGWSNLIGADFRFNLGEHVDVGASGTVRDRHRRRHDQLGRRPDRDAGADEERQCHLRL